MLSGYPFETLSLRDVDVDESELEENGETYRENALIKARFYFEKTGLTTLADDSGIFVNALEGELGVKTRRWGAGSDVSDQEWLEFFINRMREERDRRAKFHSCICLFNNEIEEYFEGECLGNLADEVLAPIKAGVPLSSVFIPDGYERVHSALSIEEKNRVSHRGKALAALREYLGEFAA